MPSLNNKALLLEISAFIADNNIRRSVLTIATNTQVSDSSLNDRSLLVKTSETSFTVIDCLDGNKATVLKCTSGPLTVQAKIGAATDAIEFDVDSVWIMTTPLTELSVKANGSRDVQMRIIQV